MNEHKETMNYTSYLEFLIPMDIIEMYENV